MRLNNFNWKIFFEQRRIDYVTSGPNTKKGNLSIKCPFCGEDDPSQHLGIEPKTGAWGCLRNAAHRGRSPVRLLQQLLRCSVEEARRLVGVKERLTPTIDVLEESFKALAGASTGEALRPCGPLKLLPEFKFLLDGGVLARPFVEYMHQRGFRDAQLSWLAKAYELHYATKGLYAYRIIIPIYDRYGVLLSWTARSIRADAQPRYRTLRVSADDAGPVAKLAANATILGLPILWRANNPRVLVLCEGPFDALKITAFGQALGVYATALFGLNIYPTQVDLIQQLAGHFGKVYLLLDQGAEFQRLRLFDTLRSVEVIPLEVPFGRKDPGELTGSEVVNLCISLIG
jgi:hypothetical protein